MVIALSRSTKVTAIRLRVSHAYTACDSRMGRSDAILRQKEWRHFDLTEDEARSGQGEGCGHGEIGKRGIGRWMQWRATKFNSDGDDAMRAHASARAIGYLWIHERGRGA